MVTALPEHLEFQRLLGDMARHRLLHCRSAFVSRPGQTDTILMLREDEDPILVLDGKQFFKRVALEELAPTKERLLDLLDSTIQQQEELLLRQGAGEHEGLPQERFLRRMIDLRDKVRQEVLKI